MNLINLKSSNLFHPITNVWGVLNKGDEKQLFLAALQYGAFASQSPGGGKPFRYNHVM